MRRAGGKPENQKVRSIPGPGSQLGASVDE